MHVDISCIDEFTDDYSVQPGGEPLVLCFVDFVSPAHAATAMDALQGEHILPFDFCEF